MTEKSNKRLITLSDAGIKMLERLMADTPYDSPSKVLSRGLEEFYRKQYNYAYVKNIGLEETTPEESARKKVKSKMLEEKIKQDELDQPKIQICKELDGEIVTNSDGSKVCVWYTHDFKSDNKQTLPIYQMDKRLVSNQYNPSKEAVLRARPELKKKK